MNLSVYVIGDGAVLDPSTTNPSFYIESAGSAILVGCGYNVFAKLREMNRYHHDALIDKIKTIVIPRMDDEHMGSLRAFLKFKRYLNKDCHATIVCPDPELMLKLLDDTQTVYRSSTAHKRPFVSVFSFEEPLVAGVPGISNMRAVKGIYKSESYGVVLSTCGDKPAVIAISGDTKANLLFESAVRQASGNWLSRALVFHNLSSSKYPSRTDIACQNDFEAEYSREFREAVKPYGSLSSDLALRAFATKEVSGGGLIWVETQNQTMPI